MFSQIFATPSASTPSGSSRITRTLLFIGGGLAAAYALYKLFDVLLEPVDYDASGSDSKVPPTKVRSLDEIVDILKDVRRAMIPVWASERRALRDIGRAPDPSQLAASQTKLQERYYSEKRIICLKHDITMEDLDYHISNVYAHEKAVTDICEELEDQFDAVLEGKESTRGVDARARAYAHVTPGVLLFLMELLFRETGKKFLTAIKDLMREQDGAVVTLDNPAFKKKIVSLRMTDLKHAILAQYGIEQTGSYTPSEVFAKLVEQAKWRDAQFCAAAEDLERKYFALMDYFMNSSALEDDVVDRIFGAPEVDFRARHADKKAQNVREGVLQQ